VTEFITEYRHYCRNPKCRTKLPTPVSNQREAFCPETTCRERFYRLRCYVCEEKKPGRLDAHTCGRRKCKNALRQVGAPYDSRRVEIASGNPIESGLPEGPKSRLTKWRILAGEIGENALHCATVPDGPDCKWEGGSYERTEAQNRRHLKAHFAKAEKIERGVERAIAVNSKPITWVMPPGVTPPIRAANSEHTAQLIPDDLTIPDFLRR
jgi:hypothetical protein